MTIGITEILNILFTIFAAVITTFLIPWLKSKTTEEQQHVIETIIENAVRAAEQIFYSGEGQEKKQYVLDYLINKKMEVDEAQIEATVNALFGTAKKNGAWDDDDVRGEEK